MADSVVSTLGRYAKITPAFSGGGGRLPSDGDRLEIHFSDTGSTSHVLLNGVELECVASCAVESRAGDVTRIRLELIPAVVNGVLQRDLVVVEGILMLPDAVDEAAEPTS